MRRSIITSEASNSPIERMWIVCIAGMAQDERRRIGLNGRLASHSVSSRMVMRKAPSSVRGIKPRRHKTDNGQNAERRVPETDPRRTEGYDFRAARERGY